MTTLARSRLDSVELPEVQPDERPPRRRLRLHGLLVGIGLTLVTVAFIYPFVWLLSASLKPRGDVFDNKLIPDTITFDNYLEVWQAAPLGLWLGETLFVTGFGALAVPGFHGLVGLGFPP